LKKEREKEKEKKAQEVAQRKQQREETAKQSQSLQATTSKKQAPKRKRVEGCTVSASGGQGRESSQAPPPKITRTGRSITIPNRFR